MLYYLLVTLLSSLLLYTACTNILPFSLKRKHICIVFLYIFFVAFLLCPLIGQTATPIALIGVQIILLFIDKKRLLNICCSLFGYALSIVVNYLIMILLEYNFNLDFKYIEKHYTLQFSVFFLLVIFLLTYGIKWILWRKFKLQDIIFSRQLLFFIVLNLIACVMIFIFNFISAGNLGYTTNVIFFNGTLFTTYFIFTSMLLFFIVKSISKEEQMKTKLIQYQNLQEYTNKIEHLYMEMRSFKHDYINILSTLSCYINNHDMEGLKEYFSNEIIPLNESFDKSNIKLGLLSNLKILELKSLLYTKLIYAISNHLDIYLDIAEPIESISMKVVDLTRVIGIFVDNAIEAAMETNVKKVEIGIIKKDDSILFIIKNSCIYENVHMNRIYDSGFSTKGDNRGIGLYSAKQVLNHYENVIHSTCIKDIQFTQQIEILNT